uniref:Uncharacterized protein n=1 Tax=Oryza glumipatula TaxID=40148 RepID=A0A0E0AB96_9ORYZ
MAAAAGSIGVYKAVFAALGALMLGTLVYTCVTDGSPFRLELLTPVATCAYVVVKLFEIKTSGPSQDPLDLLFLRQGNLSQRKSSFVIIGRIIFSILGAMMAAVVIYTVITDGLPFRKDLLTPWMAATLLDFYINVFAISVWVAHKESNWISTAIWICLLICFGSITTCGYIVIQLFQVSYQDPIYHVLLNTHNKSLNAEQGRLPSIIPSSSVKA